MRVRIWAVNKFLIQVFSYFFFKSFAASLMYIDPENMLEYQEHVFKGILVSNLFGFFGQLSISIFDGLVLKYELLQKKCNKKSKGLGSHARLFVDTGVANLNIVHS